MQIEKSSAQDNQKAREEVFHRLPAAVATMVVASTAKRHFLAAGALGFLAGTTLQTITRGVAAYRRGDDITSLNTWLPILETSALDSARTLMCLGIGSVGRKLIPNAIARNILVNEAVGFSYCRLDLLLYGKTDFAPSDALIWGISGFVGGAASPLFKNKVLAEFGFEYGREVIEELSQTYVKHGKITTAEAIMATGMAMQEGGSKGAHLVEKAAAEGKVLLKDLIYDDYGSTPHPDWGKKQDTLMEVLETCSSIAHSSKKRVKSLEKIGEHLKKRLPDSEILPIARCLVDASRSANPRIWKRAAALLYDYPPLLLAAANEHETHPIPTKVSTEIFGKVDRAVKKGPLFLQALIHLLEVDLNTWDKNVDSGNRARASMAGNSHISLYDKYIRLKNHAVKNGYFDEQLQSASEAFEDKKKFFIRKTVRKIREVKQRDGTIPITTASPLPDISSAGYMESNRKTRLALVDTLAFDLEICPNKFNNMTIDLMVLDDLAKVVGGQRPLLTKSQNRHVAAFGQTVHGSEQIKIHSILEMADSLNILVRPQVFCELVRQYPAELALIEGFLKKTFFILACQGAWTNPKHEKWQMTNDIKLLGEAIHIGLILYHVMVGPVTPKFAVSSPMIEQQERAPSSK